MSIPSFRLARELQWEGAVQQGSAGKSVRRVQEWLTLNGLHTAIDEEFGPATAAQVRAFQKAAKLAPNGIVDAETFATLTKPLSTAFRWEGNFANLRDGIVATAKIHLARRPREVGGDNRGPWVRAYCGSDGPAMYWCAGFVTTIAQQVAASIDVTLPIPYTLSCDELANAARRAGRLVRDPRSVRPGDLGLIRRVEGDWTHVFIVTEMHADHFTTIEGNTNDDGSRNGYEVCERARGFKSMDYVLLG